MSRVGTREHKGEGYLILVNQTSKPQTVTVAIEELSYETNEVWDVLDNKKVASITDGAFVVTLSGIGIDSGTKVVRLVSLPQNP